MNPSLELLEELQAIYAENYGLSIIITNENGKLILHPKGSNRLFNWFYEKRFDEIKRVIDSSEQKKWTFTTPFIYDILPGIFMIVTPVHLEDGRRYFLWAGLMIEDGTQHLIQEQLQMNEDKIIKETPIYTPDKKQEFIAGMKKLAHLASLCLKDKDAGSTIQMQNQLFQQVKQTGTNTAEILEGFLERHQEYEFLGIANKVTEEQYEVTDVFGKAIQSLKGMTFSPGEGLLGRPLITDGHEFWENVDKDPRAISLRRYSLHPKSFFCFPIKRNDGSRTLLFGGCHSNARFSNHTVELGKALGILLETGYLIQDLHTDNVQQLNRLTSLIEVCKLMVSTHDLKRIIYILVDISLNLVKGPFSCVILKEQQSENVKLVSRGNVDGHLSDYAKQVAENYLLHTESNQEFENLTPIINETPWGVMTIECPLWNRGRLFGVLCVGTSEFNKEQLQEHVNFIQTLSIMGGISLQIVEQEENGLDDKLIHSLFHAIEQFDKEAYSIAEEAAKLAKEFAESQGLTIPVVNYVTHACLLSYYSPGFIQEMLPATRIGTIIEEGNALLTKDFNGNWDTASVSAQVYALVMSYLDKKSIDTIVNSHHGGGMVQEFKAFLYETQVIEEEITLNESIVTEQELDSVTNTIKQLKLSPREQEVLDLVIQGYNNKEIAEQLYISGHTVKNHVTKIFQKLEVPDRAHAISKVYRLKHQSG
ncbi:LuxR C-terminal-related transcriptional regulator [Oceanobacillus salinisoli]|uniref:LuxR C-terminal-related transcriptional regulator n=1 Tax=Oceanobacillus salinisoli TaxID=2678611 RepID=UPI0018CC31B4|nr:LuxR C-terminal-related transcriptional regulator [Oceanobacillus salinisoli]